MKYSLFLAFLVLFVFTSAQAQFEENYTPMDSLSGEQYVLITAIEADIAALKKNAPRQVRSEMKDIYDSRAESLISLIKSGHFLDDKELNAITQDIYKEITTTNPHEGYPVRLLISRSPAVNAQCWGEGTMVINLGLLGRVTSRDELAFVMAHEMAHQLLNHANLRIRASMERLNDKNLKTAVEESGKLEVLRKLTYEGYRYSRQYEKQADSLAVELLKNTKYNWKVYGGVLTMLDSSAYPEYRNKPDIKKFFNFTQYPFNNSWLSKSKSAFGKSSGDSFIFNPDSLQSHPDIPLRIQYLDSLFKGEARATSYKLPESLQQRVDMEIPYSTFMLEDYGQAMFYTLQMLEKYPDNKFLKSLLAQLFLNLYTARKEHTFSRYVAVSKYQPHLMEDVYTFLNNLRLSEIGYIAFNYINRDSFFNKEDEAHYRMLWKISHEMKIEDVCDKVEAAYTEKFPHATKLSGN